MVRNDSPDWPNAGFRGFVSIPSVFKKQEFLNQEQRFFQKFVLYLVHQYSHLYLMLSDLIKHRYLDWIIVKFLLNHVFLKSRIFEITDDSFFGIEKSKVFKSICVIIGPTVLCELSSRKCVNLTNFFVFVVSAHLNEINNLETSEAR
ncbi:hypothetical protein BpHYR1_026577 [Brachionus plicatilis]|uniref:Uncharacterized protein n=1 Tax=Brachionus plicatilis TaxID=10195 RepID=A0A3M7RY78_BRAPC|nr:hypothetical protein BpHYR1_026577 [Brachionus plicatilis]